MADFFLTNLTDCFLARVIAINANGTLTVRPFPRWAAHRPNLTNVVPTVETVDECEIGAIVRVWFENNRWNARCACPADMILINEGSVDERCAYCCLYIGVENDFMPLRVRPEGKKGICIECDVKVIDGEACTDGVEGMIYWNWDHNLTDEENYAEARRTPYDINKEDYVEATELTGWQIVRVEIWDHCGTKYIREIGLCNCPDDYPTCHTESGRCINSEGCFIGYTLQLVNGKLECRDNFGCLEGYRFNADGCFKCSHGITGCYEGWVWNAQNNRCEDANGCPPSQTWVNGQCVNRCLSQPAPGVFVNYTWDECTGRCLEQPHGCIEGTRWNGTACVNVCPGSGQIWDVHGRRCVCPSGFTWNAETQTCEGPCSIRQVWRGSFETGGCVERCQEVNSEQWSDLLGGCICIPPTIRSQLTNRCEIPPCPEGQLWSSTLGRCYVPFIQCDHPLVHNELTGQCEAACDLATAISLAPFDIYVSAYYDQWRTGGHCCTAAYFNMTITTPTQSVRRIVDLDNTVHGRCCRRCNGGRGWSLIETRTGMPPGARHRRDNYGGEIQIRMNAEDIHRIQTCDFFVELQCAIPHNQSWAGFPGGHCHIGIERYDIAIYSHVLDRWCWRPFVRTVQWGTIRMAITGPEMFTLSGRFVNHMTNNPNLANKVPLRSVEWSSIVPCAANQKYDPTTNQCVAQ